MSKYQVWLLLVLTVNPMQSLLASWPLFAVPTTEQLSAIGVIVTDQCPAGFGKINQGASFQVNAFTANFCPSNWQWISMQETACFALDKLSYIRYSIERIQGENGVISRSVISAYYGINGVVLAEFAFSTPETAWSCYDLNPYQRVISCANDT